jgi:hypothetical protein
VRRALGAALLGALLAASGARANGLLWYSGFENGFPGEWLAYDNGSWTPSGRLPAGRTSAWTIVSRDSGEPVLAGEHAYKGWIVASAAEPHRAYPVVHLDVPAPFVNTFFVYLDTDYEAMSPRDWIQFGTWGNHDPDTGSGKWALHTLGVRERRLEFAHTEPFRGEYIGRAPQLEFPLRRWVRLTLYARYAGGEGFVQVWQDGEPVLRARIAALAENPGTRLRTAHWGMYASPGVARAVQYNDEIRICALATPPADLSAEPSCPEAGSARR